MKTLFLTITLVFSTFLYAQDKEEFYFTLDLTNHTEEQLFHVDANGSNYQFVLVGITTEGHKQLFKKRYTLKKAKFKIKNLKNTPQEVKLDSIKFTDFSNTKTEISVYISNSNGKDSNTDYLDLDFGKIGVRKTILDVKIFYKANGEENYRRDYATMGFGDHICKSRLTF